MSKKWLENRAKHFEEVREQRKKTIYNWLNRMATDSQLERSFGPQVVYRSHYLRQYKLLETILTWRRLSEPKKKNSGLL
jgi:hypothetical protein